MNPQLGVLQESGKSAIIQTVLEPSTSFDKGDSLMTDLLHSSETLTVEEVGVDEWFIVVLEDNGDGWKRNIGEINLKEDAERIAACWNACKNIPTEALESFMSKIRVALAWTGGQDDDFMRNMAVVRAVREAGKIIEDAGGDYEVLT